MELERPAPENPEPDPLAPAICLAQSRPRSPTQGGENPAKNARHLPPHPPRTHAGTESPQTVVNQNIRSYLSAIRVRASSGTTNSLTAIVYANNLFLAVGNGGT